LWDSYWDSLARSGARSGHEGQLQGKNRAEEEGPALRKFRLFRVPVRPKRRDSVLIYFFVLWCTLPKPSTTRGNRKKKINLKFLKKKKKNTPCCFEGKSVRKIFLNFFMTPPAAT
jgi:hypothetical protein